MLILIMATRCNMLDFIPFSILCESGQHCERKQAQSLEFLTTKDTFKSVCFISPYLQDVSYHV